MEMAEGFVFYGINGAELGLINIGGIGCTGTWKAAIYSEGLTPMGLAFQFNNDGVIGFYSFLVKIQVTDSKTEKSFSIKSIYEAVTEELRIPVASHFLQSLLSITITIEEVFDEGELVRPQNQFSQRTALTDAFIVVRGQELYVGKQIISHQSSYFYDQFYGNTEAAQTGRLVVDSISHDNMVLLLNAICYPLPEIDHDSIGKLLSLATQFKCDQLLSRLESQLIENLNTRLRNDPKDLASFLETAEKYKLYRLKMEFFKTFAQLGLQMKYNIIQEVNVVAVPLNTYRTLALESAKFL